MSDSQLEARVEKLEARIRRLESELEPSDPSTSSKHDRFDRPVIAALEHGETYTTSRLSKLYLTETTIRNKKTAKERVKALTQQDFFQADGINRFTYRG